MRSFQGQFRLACEYVLKIVKKGRDTLLPLLEAFVYDPLIDWTPGSETGYTGAVYGGGEAVVKETKQSRKALEREVTKAMFVVRVTEMKAEWLENRRVRKLLYGKMEPRNNFFFFFFFFFFCHFLEIRFCTSYRKWENF